MHESPLTIAVHIPILSLTFDMWRGRSSRQSSVDSQPVTTLKHIKSIVFDVALPGDNVFNALCGGPGTVPANIYSPAADDGIYVLLKPLKVGQHRLHFHAENVSQSFVEDITYLFTVVPTESEESE
jgi:hypothetical protein